MLKDGTSDGRMWATSAYVGQFGDAFVRDTELEGGHTTPDLKTVS